MSLTAHQLARLRQEVGEVLEEHGRGRPLDEFAQYRGPEGKVAFFREVLRFEPMSHQVAIAHAVHTHRRTAVRGAHATGKERSAGAEALYGAIVNRQLVLLLSATERQVIGQTMREVGKLFRANPDLPGQLLTSALRIDGEDRILAFAGSAVDALTGWHDPNGVLVIISEGQGENLEDIAYDAAIANATDPKSRVLILGNPVRPVGRFYDACRSKTWHSIRVPATEHPNVIEGRMVVPGGPAPDWPEEMAAEFGTDSPFYRSRVMAEFPESADDALVRMAWVEAAVEKWKARTFDGIAFSHDMVLALDPAGEGPDESMLAIRQGPILRELVGWRTGTTMESVERVRREAVRVRLDRGRRVTAVVDSIGVGLGVFERLAELEGESEEVPEDCDVPPVPPSPFMHQTPTPQEQRRVVIVDEVRGFKSSRSAFDTERFANARAEAYWELRRLLEEGTIALPPDALLVEELATIRWSLTGAGKILIQPKAELRIVLGRSPDRADAAAMAFAPTGPAQRFLEPYISTSYHEFGAGPAGPTKSVDPYLPWPY